MRLLVVAIHFVLLLFDPEPLLVTTETLDNECDYTLAKMHNTYQLLLLGM